MSLWSSIVLCLLSQVALTLRWAPEHVGYNLNENQTATEPKHYWGEWQNHTFKPSPDNWRFPFYVLTIDRYVDGDPTNNNANNSVFEKDWMSNQFRFGGDAAGILSDLDYLQGMGIKAIYMTGSMMLNMPWSPDGFGPLDFTLLDRHHGDIQEWRNLIDEIHRRDMYIVFDNTMATMGNLLAYGDGLTNTSVEFNWDEHDYLWKDPERQYHDFHPGNERNASCEYPRIWEQDGYLLPQEIKDQQHGCRASEFDMYGDIKGTGAYPSYVNQLSRFASVQDRLREWNPDVLEKIKLMSCMQIAMLDIDGFRMDKAVQTTIDAMAEWSDYQRQCARRFGKENFIVVGEVVADPKLSNVYIGRGKQPNQILNDPVTALATNNDTDPDSYIRPFGMTALDGIAFHYDVYGSMTRFLGLDGPWGSLGVDWVQIWNERILAAHDLVNANTGLFDPRHMFGTTNQDVFRWPALANGTQRQLLGLFVTTLELPGVPMVYFGEEQEYYSLENLAPDYVYGRTPLASSRASQLHGCYNLGEEVYVDMPFNSSGHGCNDDSISLDHRDPSHPLRNYLKRMFELRNQFPVLNDGYNLTTLSTRLVDLHLRGSQGMPSPTGIWSIHRGRSEQHQDFTGIGQGNQGVWLVFSNDNKTVTYDFDCSAPNPTGNDGPLLSSFDQGTVVKNLFYPYEEYTLQPSTFQLGLENSNEANGCLPQLTLRPWDFKAFVPKSAWVEPKPVITNAQPRHDARLKSTVEYGETESVSIQLEFSSEMNCNSIANNLVIESTTLSNTPATLKNGSVQCRLIQGGEPAYPGYVRTEFVFEAELENVANGVHTYTLQNATTADGQRFTGSRDKFMFRIGQDDNPMVFALSSNYTAGLLQQDPNTKQLLVSPRAAGADKYRYSTNFGSSFSKWQDYVGGNILIEKQDWSGSKAQEWEGEHIVIHYWSRMTGSSDHVQHSDLDWEDRAPRRWPHAWIEGEWNQWGYDAGIKNQMAQSPDGNWTFDLYTHWPHNITVNVWGMNPDGQPDKSAAFGDIDRDNVLDWLPPDSIANNVINISAPPEGMHLGYRITVNDGNYNFALIPIGSAAIQGVVMILICIIPVITAIACVVLFIRFFYKVKFNQVGLVAKQSIISKLRGFLTRKNDSNDSEKQLERRVSSPDSDQRDRTIDGTLTSGLATDAGSSARRTVLIATMEYEIPDWQVKVKIGGLGVMASLMGNQLRHQNLLWVVPCLGDITYPLHSATMGEPIEVNILDHPHIVECYYYNVKNITYIVLDAPIFRSRTKADPYPPRMDDLESGVYYSAWNQCIATAIARFRPDIYHINDYHGAVAPLYLLPETVPCCLSLHNAEFQGLWSLRTSNEMNEMCRVFNLPESIVRKYIQYGEVFNLLHAGASYLRVHQGGFGAVGVSGKYGQRSSMRYPIFWGLNKIGALPNPDPTDTAPLSKASPANSIEVDQEWEEKRLDDRCKAQEWAGLKVDRNAELFIFVGRWSNQKGVDLIADVFMSVLESNPSAQLICIGPVIDLHGKFAALKLSKLMDKYPGRVFSKPEFTMLPPYIFSGAEFALMPSRDEPFGLVAVEFGRKGALCVGSRVGGFGNMPGWWFTVESVTSKHLLSQFKSAIQSALSSDKKTRSEMRAYSKLQRFPVAQWVEDLEKLQTGSIQSLEKQKTRAEILGRFGSFSRGRSRTSMHRSGSVTPSDGATLQSPTPVMSPVASPPGSRAVSRGPSMNDMRGFYNSATPYQSAAPSRAASIAPPSRAVSRANSVYDGEEDVAPSRRLSVSSISKDVVDDSTLQTLQPIFNDQRSVYYDKFSEKLDKQLNAKTSVGDLCIEEYLVKSERKWFNKLHDATLGVSPSSTSITQSLRSFTFNKKNKETEVEAKEVDSASEYGDYLGGNYKTPSGVKKLLSRKIGAWPLYCFLLAFGQIISANAYQLTLLTGQVGEPANKLYILSAIYLVGSLMWWLLYRRFQAIFVLAPPFFFFGAAFFILGITIAVKDVETIGWLQNVASGLYGFGSSAGTMFFTLNFGTEGGTPSQTWAFRAWVISGTQQILIAFLWYWGSYLVTSNGAGSVNLISSPKVLTAVSMPLAALMWTISILLFLGLPKYYRQKPGAIPSFYTAVCRRGVVLWFWVMVILQGYWLSSNFNRNWMYLWSSNQTPRWVIALVVLFFFIGVWSGLLTILAMLSRKHSWIIPIFAIGLGAPRWCQFIWSMSGIGYHIPWISNPAVSGFLSRSIWSWLGVLDAVQGVGFGMILLMTLTRIHVIFTLTMSQAIGAAITILARATAPNKIGPAGVFINFASDSLGSVYFWLALICQLIICVGWFKFFRKAQLQKP